MIGYDKPLKSNKAMARKTFYRIFLKDLGSNIQQLGPSLRNQDRDMRQSIGINNFMNVVQSFSSKLAETPEIIKIVG